jgi:hypothetical protein
MIIEAIREADVEDWVLAMVFVLTALLILGVLP